MPTGSSSGPDEVSSHPQGGQGEHDEQAGDERDDDPRHPVHDLGEAREDAGVAGELGAAAQQPPGAERAQRRDEGEGDGEGDEDDRDPGGADRPDERDLEHHEAGQRDGDGERREDDGAPGAVHRRRRRLDDLLAGELGDRGPLSRARSSSRKRRHDEQAVVDAQAERRAR